MRPFKAPWQFPVCCLFHCLKEVIYTKIILYFLTFLVALWLGPLFMFPHPSINLDLWAEFPHFLQWSHKVKVRTFSPSNSSDFQFQAEKHDPLFYFKPLKSGKLSFMLLNLGSNNTALGGWWNLFKELNLPQTPGYILLYLKRDRRGPPVWFAFSLTPRFTWNTLFQRTSSYASTEASPASQRKLFFSIANNLWGQHFLWGRRSC